MFMYMEAIQPPPTGKQRPKFSGECNENKGDIMKV